eukprot:628892-Prymnesium_polylepis.1
MRPLPSAACTSSCRQAPTWRPETGIGGVHGLSPPTWVCRAACRLARPQAEGRAQEVARRTYLIERLTFVAQEVWAWASGGFSGLASCNTHTLEEALVQAWHLPQGVMWLLHDVPPQQRPSHAARLRAIVEEIE